jgi:hypothetical protein
VLIVAVALGPVGAAWGEDSIFDALADVVKRFAAPAREDEPVVEIARQFMPQLRTIMDMELHFAHKVCRFNEEQLASLKQAGRADVEALAAQMAEQMNHRALHLGANMRLEGNRRRVIGMGGVVLRKNGNVPIEVFGGMADNVVVFGGMGGDAGMGMGMVAQEANIPDSRKLLQQALQQKIAEMVPAEVAERYRAELAGREQAQREAAREMMLLHIDRRVQLTAEQYDALAAAIDRNWNDAWTTNLEAYWHEALAPMPPMDVLRTHLTMQQEALWKERNGPHMGNVAGFGDMGMGMMGGFEMAVPAGDVEEQLLILDPQ